MKSIEISPKKLKGSINVPSSKSISHRYIIFACLSKSISIIKNVLLSKDIIATIDSMISLGANITIEKTDNIFKTITIDGTNTFNVSSPVDLFVNESGSTLRFLIPLSLLSNSEVTFTGNGKLPDRPLDIYFDLFKEKSITYKKQVKNLPLTINGKLPSGDYYIDGDVSSQFISGLLFTLPLLDGDSTIFINNKLESKPYVDLTLDALNKFNISIINNNYESFNITGGQKYSSRNISVEADFSQAAFWIVSNALGNNVIYENLNVDSLQGDKEILNIVKMYDRDTNLVEIDVMECPDLVPIIAVLASMSKIPTRIFNGKRVRLKECDRLSAITKELNKIGAAITEFEDGLFITPVKNFTGGVCSSHNDHRIAMALAIASTCCTSNLTILDSMCIEKSYPHFYEDFILLGGNVNEHDMG